jgi:hypothetical protein
MITHFLKRDFKDSIVSWIVLSVISAFCVPLCLGRSSEELLWVLSFFYFMFAIVQMPNLIGSIVRNDHMISRHYFLSLPFERTGLFYILILRMSVFFLPLWIFGILIAPIHFYDQLKSLPNSHIAYIVYCLGVTMGFIWFSAASILQSLFLEESLRFSSSRRRVLTGLTQAFIGMVEIFLFHSCFYYLIRFLTGAVTLGQSSLITFGFVSVSIAVPTALTLVTLKLAKSRWTASR